MSGKVSNWELCNNNTDITNPKHFSVCNNNISKVINENIADFIALQEAKDFKKLIDVDVNSDINIKGKKKINGTKNYRLCDMPYRLHESHNDTCITFWNPTKFKLLGYITGEFEAGRPWIACFFTNGIVFINVHLGHYKLEEEIMQLSQMIETIIIFITKKYNKYIIKRFIIAGDFNFDIKNISGKGFLKLPVFKNNTDNSNDKNKYINFYYNPKHILTCCIRRNTHFDHVLDTQNKPINITIPKVNYMASDHKPIFVNLEK